MAFLCPVRIRSNNGTKKKKPSEKKRSFLATVNSIIGDSESVPSVNDNNNSTAASNATTTGPGRITGSSSIETLVRVGLEKEAGIPPESRNMVVLHDFTPCVDDELEVRRGSVVSILYRENDWAYVILEQLPNGACPLEDTNREGFIPFSYCSQYGSPLAEMALCSNKNRVNDGGGGTRDDGGGGGGGKLDGQGHRNFDHHDSGGSATTTAPFYKDPSPTRYIALYKFTARDENDVNVERGEILTVLNKDDPDWFYVVRSDGQEGFVPSAFVYPFAPQQQQHQHQQGSANTSASSQQQLHHSVQQPTYQQIGEVNEYSDDVSNLQQQASPKTAASSGDFTSQSPTGGGVSPHINYGTELVMLYDYKAQAPDDLSVRRGDWVYADLMHQTVEGWLWAYAPKQRKYGFIPRVYARPPAMTSL